MSNTHLDESRSPQIVLPLDYEPKSAPRFWTVGTLAYSAGGLVVLFCWLLWGDFAWSMRDRSIQPVVQFLLKKFGASDTIMAVLLSTLPAGIGIILGPIISYRSDRHRGRWGRRIPYLLITTPICALAMTGLAFSGVIGGVLHRVLGTHSPGETMVTLTVFGTFWTSFECAAIAAGAVFGGLINDVVPTQFLGRFYGLFRALSLIAGIIFNRWLIGATEKHSQWLFAGIAVLYGVGVMMMCLMVKEGSYPPPADVEHGQRKSFLAAAKLYFQECFSNSYYIWVFLAFTVATLCFLPINLFSVPFAESLGIDMQGFGNYAALTYVISLCLAYSLGSLADRFHPLRVSIIALGLYAIVTLWGSIYATTPLRYGIALVAHGVISGTYFTTSASLGQRLFPHSTFAQFASAAGLVTAVATIAISPFFGVVLDVSGHHYRYTYLMSFILTILALFLMLIVYRLFLRLGGPNHYAAPQ